MSTGEAGAERPAAGTTYRQVWRLAWPIILSNSSIPLLGMVDTAVVGHLPEPYYIGAVAVGAMLFSFLYWGFGFLRMGTGGLTAQAVGARGGAEIRAVLGRGLLLSVAFGLGLILLQWPAIEFALRIIEPSPEVAGLARDYFLVRIWGAPAALANFCLLGWFIGLQNTRLTLVIQIFMNGLNILLDLWFVLGLGWGVTGVAAATLIAELAAVALGLALAARHLARLGGAWSWSRILDPWRLRHMMSISRDIFLRTLFLILAFAYFTTSGARMGDLTLAVNAVLMHLLHMQAYGMDGFAHAAEALAGKAFGARDRTALRRAVVLSGHWSLLVALLYAAVTAVFGGAIVALITNQAEVRSFAADFLPWLAAMPVVSVWAYLFDGIFVGTTHSREMRNGSIASFVVFVAGMWVFPPLLGNHGLWLALTLWMGARGATLALFYPRIERAAAA